MIINQMRDGQMENLNTGWGDEDSLDIHIHNVKHAVCRNQIGPSAHPSLSLFFIAPSLSIPFLLLIPQVACKIILQNKSVL